jgi:DtxR family Mn-dependent transcriptional regulator
VNTDEAYLRAIYLLGQVRNGRVGTGAVADHLGVTHPTATDMIGKLAEAGLVDHEKYAGVELTDRGRERALDALETYCTVQRFLSEVLGVEEYRTEAAAIESVVDGEVADRLLLLVDSAADCPDCFDPVAGRCRRLDDRDDDSARNGSADACTGGSVSDAADSCEKRDVQPTGAHSDGTH